MSHLNYGLSQDDLVQVKDKIQKQKNYLESNNFFTSTGQELSLLDVSYSANHSTRYYARILNKVDTFVSYNISIDYVPLFLTCTLDGFFRDFLNADYSRFTEETRDFYKRHIPNNNQNGKILDAIDNKETLTNKDLYKILSHQWNRFTQSYALRKIKKDEHTYSYMRVTEPHKNGTPHFHILMYVPRDYLSLVYDHFHKCFPAPQNKKPLTPQDNGRVSNTIIGDYKETQGFQTAINTSAGYILKYILKSFVDVSKGNEIDYLQAWYIKNKIPRIITSQTLIPQDIYHSLSILEDDWYYLSNIKYQGSYFRDNDMNYFELKIDNRLLVGDNGIFYISNNGRIVATYGKKVYQKQKIRFKSLKFTSKKPHNFSIMYLYEFYIGIQYQYTRKDNYTTDYVAVVPDSYSVPVSEMSIQSLIELYTHFDFDLMIPQKFCTVRNEMIYRGFLHEQLGNYKDYDDSFYYDLESYPIEDIPL